jgi:type IV pilus assembly protein PilC
MDFKYTAKEKNGKTVSGRVRAVSMADGVSQLKANGLLPLRLVPVAAKPRRDPSKGLRLFEQKITLRELAIFTRQLSFSLLAGVTIIESLDMLAKDMSNRRFADIIQDAKASIEGGSLFSGALLKYPAIFPVSYIAMVKAGEQSGRLGDTLGHLARYLENMDRIARKIKSATRYPIFICGFTMLVVSIIVFFIIPKFRDIFAQARVQLPLLTRIVVAISENTLKNLHWIALTVVALSAIWVLLLQNRKIRFGFDRRKMKVFLLGELIRKALMVRLARSLSILLTSGVGLATSLQISCEATNNLFLRDIIEKVTKNVVAGATLSNEFKNHEIFPSSLIKMVEVGEKTGRLGDMFGRCADYYDDELETTIAGLTSLIEPVLIVFIGAIVLVVVLALYLPIFKMSMAVR